MEILQFLIHAAGLAQIVLVAGSLFVPAVLQWKVELSKVSILIKQMFWTYSAYIFMINLCFGSLSLFAANDIIDSSRLATIVTGFIAVYWISRVLVQFFYFDKSGFPTGRWHRAAEVALTTLFIMLSVIYTWATIFNLSSI